MYKYPLSGIMLIFLLLLSCASNNEKTAHVEIPQITVLEEFADSTLIGRQGKNKIEIKKYTNQDSIYTEILFYRKENNEWLLQQKQTFPNSAVPDLDVEIIDFDNDGYSDMAYVPDIAARGANIIRSLFIYDAETDRLVAVKNSTEYPNLSYNETLDCMDSHAIYGGSTTSFLRLQAESLFCFAEVTLSGKERTVKIYDESGNESVLLNDTLGNEEHVHIRFSDYEPSKVMEEYNALTKNTDSNNPYE